MASENCNHCPSPNECACPSGREACRKGACPCPPNCPCKPRGCLPFPPDGPWRNRLKFGCLPLVVGGLVIITILILSRDDDKDGGENVVLPTSTTLTVTTAPATTTTVAPTTVAPTTTRATPVTTPISPDLREIIDRFCLPVPPDATSEDLDDLLFGPFEVLQGPNPGDTPPPLGSNDPALEFLRVGMVGGDCGGDPFAVVIAELGGSPDVLQLSLGLDTDPNTGRPQNPTANNGLGRLGGWDLFIAAEPDGTTFVSDADFQPVDERVFTERRGNVVAIGVHTAQIDSFFDIDYDLQLFRRDVQQQGAPVDWAVASGKGR